MAVDLFGIVLGSAVSWGVSRILDAATDCLCGSRQGDVPVANSSFNRHSCGRCGRALEQYTNATAHTVNRNGSIASAHVSSIHWPSWNSEIKIYYDLNTAHSKYEDVVVEIILSQFRGSEFAHNESRKRPQYERTHWEDSWFSFSRSCFPQGSYVFAVDFKTYNLWGDLLHHTRTLSDF